MPRSEFTRRKDTILSLTAGLQLQIHALELWLFFNKALPAFFNGGKKKEMSEIRDETVGRIVCKKRFSSREGDGGEGVTPPT
jgi:hypothetical protein